MKRLLLSAAAAVLTCSTMSAVTYNVNEVDPGEITGTYNETVYKEDGSVQTYANWQPLEEVVFGGYTFTFTK